jgi:fructose 1,6-bisphosphatase
VDEGPREFFDSPRFDNARANQQTLHDLLRFIVQR